MLGSMPSKVLKGKKRSEIVLESSPSEAEQSERSSVAPFKGAKPHHSGESDPSDDETDNNEEDEQDFIVDDDPDGVPPAQLPLAFSLSTHQDLTHHFKVVCQLFVHITVRPLVERRPFLERVLKGLTVRISPGVNDLRCHQRRNILLCHYKSLAAN